MIRALVLAAFAAALPAPAAQVQSPAPAPVNVTLGAGLESEADRFGRAELDGLERDLAKAVARPAARGGFTRLDLRLEYARPNHPTSTQLGRRADLSPRSLAIGGATLTGVAYRADGSSSPLKFSWWETDLRLETAVGVWDDAERAFERLGAELGRGRIPDRFAPGTQQPRGHTFANDAF